MEKSIKDVTGYNGNKLVKEDHVFFMGDGCWYATIEDARKYNPLHDIGVGHYIVEKQHEGVTLYREFISNIWD